MSDKSDREKALAALERLSWTKVSSGNKWRNAGYFGVPGEVMRQLAKEGLCQTRKLNGHSPQEYRP